MGVSPAILYNIHNIYNIYNIYNISNIYSIYMIYIIYYHTSLAYGRDFFFSAGLERVGGMGQPERHEWSQTGAACAAHGGFVNIVCSNIPCFATFGGGCVCVGACRSPDKPFFFFSSTFSPPGFFYQVAAGVVVVVVVQCLYALYIIYIIYIMYIILYILYI